MNKTSTKILVTIGSIVSIISTIMALIYVLTGQTLSFNGTNYFVGHILDSKGRLTKHEAPEILAYLTFIVAMFAMVFTAIGMALSTKGLSKPEKKAQGKKWNLLGGGNFVSMISGLILIIVAPKNTSISIDSYHSVVWFYLIMAGFLTGAVIIVIALIRLFKNSKAPIIKS